MDRRIFCSSQLRMPGRLGSAYLELHDRSNPLRRACFLRWLPKRLAELKRSAVYCVSNIGTTLVSGFTTFVVGIVLTDPTEIAYWSLALTTVSAVQALYSPISSSLYPHVVAHRDLGAVRKMAIMAAPALLVGTVAYCLLSPQVFFLLGGQGYVAGSWVMVALSLSCRSLSIRS